MNFLVTSSFDLIFELNEQYFPLSSTAAATDLPPVAPPAELPPSVDKKTTTVVPTTLEPTTLAPTSSSTTEASVCEIDYVPKPITFRYFSKAFF